MTRNLFTAYVSDAEALQQVKAALAAVGWDASDCHLGGIAGATAALTDAPSPWILLVDLSDSTDIMNDLGGLAQVCDPSIVVITIGSSADEKLRNDLLAMGIRDYLTKPLTNDTLNACLQELKKEVPEDIAQGASVPEDTSQSTPASEKKPATNEKSAPAPETPPESPESPASKAQAEAPPAPETPPEETVPAESPSPAPTEAPQAEAESASQAQVEASPEPAPTEPPVATETPPEPPAPQVQAKAESAPQVQAEAKSAPEESVSETPSEPPASVTTESAPSAPSPSPTAKKASVPLPPIEEREGAYVVAVVGARGGTGATMVATSLAWTCSHMVGSNTALFDADIHFGSGALALDIDPTDYIIEGLRAPQNIDARFLAQTMTQVKDNLYVLASEAGLDESASENPESYAYFVAAMRRAFDVTVVDIPRHILLRDPRIISYVDMVIFVCDATLPSVRDMLRLHHWRGQHAPKCREFTIVNKYKKLSHELSLKEFESYIEQPANAVLPYNARVAHHASKYGKSFAEIYFEANKKNKLWSNLSQNILSTLEGKRAYIGDVASDIADSEEATDTATKATAKGAETKSEAPIETPKPSLLQRLGLFKFKRS